MTNRKPEPFAVKIMLSLEAHSRAKELLSLQYNARKAKEVYLNYLAVYATDRYLRRQGFETNLDVGDRSDPVKQTLMNVADLDVKDCGKLECLPVMPDADIVRIPPEVWEERIGYVAVRLDESLREATLLGFVQKADREELPLEELQSLEDLSGYLNENRNRRVEVAASIVNLSQWLVGTFEPTWQAVESIWQEAVRQAPKNNLAFRFRRKTNFDTSFESGLVRRGKAIELGAVSIIIILGLNLDSVNVQSSFQDGLEELENGQEDFEIDIILEVHPGAGQKNLPRNLEIFLLDEEGEVAMETKAKQDYRDIQLEFSAYSGDRFSVRLTLDSHSVTEEFFI
ncbi:MAG: DUF1822 family protein [Oscillatoria sp. SIO1A7]|nr:DUF1822 family protein [Oscillatoria sp. SIO1A7]